ncbi:Spermatogenesis-associated protein 5 [Porphyridium purpureum]|uniref:Spermatogenesis-associated protein 5 n=1 Tax=Porphyridium purpureum TaxID=35688 RepID=A0A5J4YJV2_PORPP|nr:Spermatogenesis-associated protein 5 [Porphyridium purpureum]|eukprot:POR6826..scf270_19
MSAPRVVHARAVRWPSGDSDNDGARERCVMHPQWMREHGFALGMFVGLRGEHAADEDPCAVLQCWPSSAVMMRCVGVPEHVFDGVLKLQDVVDGQRDAAAQLEASPASTASASKTSAKKKAKKKEKEHTRSRARTPAFGESERAAEDGVSRSVPERGDSRAQISVRKVLATHPAEQVVLRVLDCASPQHATCRGQEWHPDRILALRIELGGTVVYPQKRVRVLYLGRPVELTVHSVMRANDIVSQSCDAGEMPLSAYVCTEATRVAVVPCAGDVLEADLEHALLRQHRIDVASTWERAGIEERLAELRLGGMHAVVDRLTVLLALAFGRDIEPGIQRPKGVILYGVPGTGKTLVSTQLCRALYLNTHVFHASDMMGGDIGLENEKLSEAFERAAMMAPCVLLLDELDAIAPATATAGGSSVSASSSSSSAHALWSSLHARIASLMDEIEPRTVFVIGTTNRIDAVHASLRRAGRFGQEIMVDVPSEQERLDILRAVARDALRDEMVDDRELAVAARDAHGFVAADLVALWRESVHVWSNLSQGPGARICPSASLGKIKPSALREVEVQVARVGWDEIGGQLRTKVVLKEAMSWALNQSASAIPAPRGILLFGPPGCSKTLLAKAVATECAANFIAIKGAELLSKWVGESEKAVRETFRRARTAAPCVVFFDEIDALAVKRGNESASKAEHRVLAQLLTELDGISGRSHNQGILMLAATNRPDTIDTALLRPGRIDRMIYVGLPTCAERREILRVHTKRVPLATEKDAVDLDRIADDCHGMSGAELAALVREASLAALEEDPEHARTVCQRHFELARRRVGPRTPLNLLELYDDYRKNTKGVFILE